MLRPLSLAAALLVVPSAWSQDYPARPIRIIVPFPAGGTADIMPRIFGEKLGAKWGQPVIVDNRPGAAGNIGAELVYKAESDGYTLLSAPPAPLVINPSLYPKLGFDPARFVTVGVMGTAPALAALLGNETNLMFDNLGVSLPHALSGRLRALAVCSERRVTLLPQVPAMAETYPGFVSVAWFGVVAPPGTSPKIATRLSAAIAEAIKLPDVAKRLADLSADPVGSTPAQMAAFMKEDAGRWRKVIESAGVKLD
jgi:tripartite-type tricarboxylate transporter receptor subunit TctC